MPPKAITSASEGRNPTAAYGGVESRRKQSWRLDALPHVQVVTLQPHCRAASSAARAPLECRRGRGESKSTPDMLLPVAEVLGADPGHGGVVVRGSVPGEEPWCCCPLCSWPEIGAARRRELGTEWTNGAAGRCSDSALACGSGVAAWWEASQQDPAKVQSASWRREGWGIHSFVPWHMTQMTECGPGTTSS